MRPGELVRQTLPLALALLFAAVGVAKMAQVDISRELFVHWGFPPWALPAVGAVEFTAAVLLVLPPTRLSGGLLAFGVMAGAIATHISHGEVGAALFAAFVGTLCAGTAWTWRATEMDLLALEGTEEDEPVAREDDRAA